MSMPIISLLLAQDSISTVPKQMSSNISCASVATCSISWAPQPLLQLAALQCPHHDKAELSMNQCGQHTVLHPEATEPIFKMLDTMGSGSFGCCWKMQSPRPGWMPWNQRAPVEEIRCQMSAADRMPTLCHRPGGARQLLRPSWQHRCLDFGLGSALSQPRDDHARSA